MAPHSETETVAAVNLLKSYRYPLVVCYHSKGEEVYWGFKENQRHKAHAEKIAAHLGYALKKIENSAGGLKDFYAQGYAGLGLTIEVGEDRFSHPYPAEQIPALIKRHRGSIELMLKIGEEIGREIYGGSPSGSGKGL
jgi:g-D-glutamyl-meso-diaminopimelate peptidase